MKFKSLDRYVLVTISCLMLLTTTAYAGVKGQCSNCHTMHNSQDGATLEDMPSANLTKGNCVGCHTGVNTGNNTTPFVFSTNMPNNSSLAGGNFYWVAEDERKGHNVSGIPTMLADSVLTTAPGGQILCADSCHVTLHNPKPIGSSKALDTGCEGCHLDTKHHAPTQAVGTVATRDHGYYRFLSGHMSGGGVHGIEATDWEYNADAHNHNEYLGDTDKLSKAPTMTNYCTGCHGDFHDQKNAAGNWIRHPSDAVIPNSGEYALYNVYDPVVPVARTNLAEIEETAMLGDGDMVMCLSCHRAHGSSHPDALRWDYTKMTAGDGGYASGTGCFKCHSDKD